jgi:MFS family permease
MIDSTSDIRNLKRVRFAIFVFYFLQGLCFASWASRIPDIKGSLGLDDASWGTILLMIPIGQICGMTLSGLLVSRIGSKRILPIAIIGYTLTLILIGLANSEYILIMCLIIFGFFGNFCNISVNTQGVTIESLYDKPIMASFHGGWSLAGLTGASIGLLMTVLHIQPFYHFVIIATLVVIGFITNYKYLQPDLKKEKSKEELEAKKKTKPESFLYLLGLVAFCGMAAEGAMSDWSGLYLKDVVGISESLAPMGLTAYMITMATGRFFIDKATQKWGRQRVIQCGGLLISAGLFLSVAYPHPVVTLLAFMIIGLGTAGIVPSVYSIAGQKTKISTGMALTIVSSVSFLGFLMGPPLIGYISHATNLRISYAVIGLFGICIIILASKIRVVRSK